MKNKIKIKIKPFLAAVLRMVFLTGVSYIILHPLLTKFSSSLMTINDMFDDTVKWVPRTVTLQHYRDAWNLMNYPHAFRNSFTLTLTVSMLQLMSCTLVGYGLGRFKFKGGKIIFALVLFTLVVPPQMVMVPMYLTFRYFDIYGLLPSPGLNLLNSYWPFVLMSGTAVGLRNGLFIYIMRQFFRGMPKDLEDAAYVDGAGLFRTFLTIMLPGAVPGLVIVFLFAFVWQWNDYFYITLFIGGKTDFLTHALDNLALRAVEGRTDLLRNHYSSLITNTGMLMFIAPLLLLYAVMQRYFVESIERTGIIG
ncbi:MAG TPA: carbohydrate ABC transporter permease [Limnochordia bacterium]|nr:carbohydrate ABC transporter permease [Limnochordia bacterium]